MPSQLDPNDSQRLSQAIADARSERPTKSDDLDRFRAVLLHERKAGAPVRALKAGLAKIGVDVSDETLRTWLIANGAPKQRAASPAPKGEKVSAPSERATPAPRAPMPTKAAVESAAPVTTPPLAVRVPGPRVARDDI